VPDLVRGLVGAESWWTRLYCANALAAIGVSTPPVSEALLEKVRTSDVAHLRAVCVEALIKLDLNAVGRVLAAVDDGAFAVRERAVEALCRCGEPAIADLIGALESGKASSEVAREALLRIGWPAITRLEAAGHGELAQESLRIGPLQGIAWIDEFEVEYPPAQPPELLLPTIVWESGYGHGHGLVLYRAEEDEQGYRIDRVWMSNQKEDARWVTRVGAAWMRIPRARALEAARQLRVLAGTAVRARPHDGVLGRSRGRSTGNFHARLRAETGEIWLDESFCGYPASDNVPQRFRAEAAVRVMAQAMSVATWTERAFTAQDREFVRARYEGGAKDVWWVTDRLKVMAEAVRED
jgi:hypothetical protein